MRDNMSRKWTDAVRAERSRLNRSLTSRISCPTELVPRARRVTSSKSWFRYQRGSQQIVDQSLHDFAAVAERELHAVSGPGVDDSVNSASGVIARKLSNEHTQLQGRIARTIRKGRKKHSLTARHKCALQGRDGDDNHRSRDAGE